MPRNRILYEAGDAVHYAYFPTHGMASLLAITEDGSTIEIGAVGREGYPGAPILHQVGITPYRVTAQMPMTALRMEAKAFLAESNRAAPLREMLLRYAHVVETQLVQAVVCNLTHTVEQRLARRLMVMSDFVESETFEVTQEQLSLILDRHRNRISAASIVRERRTNLEVYLSLATLLVSILRQWNSRKRPASWMLRASIARWHVSLRRSSKKITASAI